MRRNAKWRSGGTATPVLVASTATRRSMRRRKPSYGLAAARSKREGPSGRLGSRPSVSAKKLPLPVSRSYRLARVSGAHLRSGHRTGERRGAGMPTMQVQSQSACGHFQCPLDKNPPLPASARAATPG